jgi:mono/diheme cytochrome c family protein
LPICPAGDDKKGGGKDPDKASLWMTKKLEFSQKILRGLTMGDFEMARKNADAMVVVGYLESWDRAGTPEYKKQLKSFESANKELVRQAEMKDIGAATRAYAQLVVSCIECHNVVRDAKKK